MSSSPPSPLGSLYPFASHYVTVPGGRMHYVDEGDGPPILLLHGNPTWSFYYREIIKGLRDRYRVIAPDHIGCGLSDKPREYPYTLATHIDNLSRLCEHLDLRDVVLGVHDWGGPIGFGWAVGHADRVRGLVVFNTAAFLAGRMPFRIRLSGWPIVGEAAILQCNTFAKAATRMAVHRKERMTPAVKRGYLFPYDTPAHRIAHLAFVRDIPYTDRVPSHRVIEGIEGDLPRLGQLPTVIFWGMRDFCFTPAFLDEWTRRFPDAEVHRLAEAGHYVVEDAHELILPTLQRFVARVQPDTAGH